jgi:hypothetical protein
VGPNGERPADVEKDAENGPSGFRTTDTSRPQGHGEKPLHLSGAVDHPDRGGGQEQLSPKVAEIVSGYIKARRSGQALTVTERRKLRDELIQAMTVSSSIVDQLPGDKKNLWDIANQIFQLDDAYPATFVAKNDDVMADIKRNIAIIRAFVEKRTAGATAPAKSANFITKGHAGDVVTTADVDAMMDKALAHGTPIASNPHELKERGARFVTATDIDSRIRVDGTRAPAFVEKATEDALHKSLANPKRGE